MTADELVEATPHERLHEAGADLAVARRELARAQHKYARAEREWDEAYRAVLRKQLERK